LLEKTRSEKIIEKILKILLQRGFFCVILNIFTFEVGERRVHINMLNWTSRCIRRVRKRERKWQLSFVD
jgi:acetolactate synthase regulatory subunit